MSDGLFKRLKIGVLELQRTADMIELCTSEEDAIIMARKCYGKLAESFRSIAADLDKIAKGELDEEGKDTH